MLYYGLFWMRHPYLDIRWRSRSTGTILELFIASIVWHKNKNRWVGGSPVEIMFIVLCSDISQVWRTREISLHKTIHMISTGYPPPICSCYNIWSHNRWDAIVSLLFISSHWDAVLTEVMILGGTAIPGFTFTLSFFSVFIIHFSLTILSIS